MARIEWSDLDKVAALSYMDANIIPRRGKPNFSAASKVLGIPRKTLADWFEARSINRDVAEMRHENKEEIAERFKKMRDEVLDHLLPHKLAATSAKDLITMAAVLTDKILLLEGLPTAITRDLTEEERVDRINELLTRAERRAKATPLPPPALGQTEGLA